jgi:NAD(P)-dependent dehydrogenase (short-subunit alcohol dehydrogenase family)
MRRSYVVTGGGRGVGRAIVERLLDAGDCVVVAIELDESTLAWTESRADALPVVGDAADEAVAERAADLADGTAPLAGWVNNAAVFRDASVHSDSARDVLDIVVLNLGPAVVGCAAAIRRFLASGSGGAIVNVSSHQARRPVRGSLPYATAKAAIEGLTRSLAVDYGPSGIRVNAVALGSVATERYERYLAGAETDAARRIEEELQRLHPLGRVGRVEEVAAVVTHLLSDEASFVNGAVVPIDGGRSVLGLDPEAHEPGA